MANTVGLTVRTTAKRPHLRGVVLDAQGALVRTFEHQCSAGQDHEMLHALGQALATELAAQPVRTVLIREGGFAPGTGLTTATKNRLRGEGVALGVARAVTKEVMVTDSKGIGRLLGLEPEDADAQGAALVPAAYSDASAAALAAQQL